MKKILKRVVASSLAFLMGAILMPVIVNAEPAVGQYSVSVTKTENAQLENATLEIQFFNQGGGNGESVGFYMGLINEEDHYVLQPVDADIPAGVQSLCVKCQDAGQGFQSASVKINGNNVLGDANILNSENGFIYDITTNDTLAVEIVIGGNNQQGGDQEAPAQEFKYNVHMAGAFFNMRFNQRNMYDESQEFDKEEYSVEGTVNAPGTYSPNEFNVLEVFPRFGDQPLLSVTVNGTKYTADSEAVDIPEEGNDEGVWYVTVPGDVAYDIDCIADMDAQAPRTIIWANPDFVPRDEEEAEWASQFTVQNGIAKVVSVVDENGNPVEVENGGLENGFGWVMVYPGWKVTFEFFPKYGYQLTNIVLNEMPMEASSTMNQFTVEIPNANLHFAAVFTKTDDIVKANSTKVDSGSIALGSALEGGSAQLTVNDANVSSDKAAAFQSAAGDYQVGSILDLDLYNVYYKGKADANDVWSKEITELGADATITIKLATGLNADDIVIVHNVHDGDDFEILPIVSYDPETGLLTFKAKSFSNFAIATKGDGHAASYSTSTPVTSAPAATTVDTVPKTAETFPIVPVMVVAIVSFATMAVVVFERKRRA